MQLEGRKLNNWEVLLVLFKLNCYPLKVTRDQANISRGIPLPTALSDSPAAIKKFWP